MFPFIGIHSAYCNIVFLFLCLQIQKTVYVCLCTLHFQCIYQVPAMHQRFHCAANLIGNVYKCKMHCNALWPNNASHTNRALYSLISLFCPSSPSWQLDMPACSVWVELLSLDQLLSPYAVFKSDLHLYHTLDTFYAFTCTNVQPSLYRSSVISSSL